MAHFPPSISPSNQGGGGSPRRESPAGSSATSRCCDTGRPLFTDPITGQTVCSCQYEMLSYQRLPGLPVYPPYPPEAVAAYLPALDQPPFYTSGYLLERLQRDFLNNHPNESAVGLEVKDGLGAGGAPAWPYPSVYHPYDAAFAGYPFNGYGMDLNGARRKNATRETTSTLKAWLNEHKKNPYPTKGEKIMLAIITKMTLTQVSTWFANARRRLKKENKMTWEPRNRVDEEDNNNEESPSSKDDNKDNHESKESGGSEEGGGCSGGPGGGADTGSDWSGSRAGSPECLGSYSPGPPPQASQPPKPRIWSLADMAKEDPRVPGGGKAPTPLRLRPPDLYRWPIHPDPAVLETYSRMAAAAAAAAAAASTSSAELKPPPPRP